MNLSYTKRLILCLVGFSSLSFALGEKTAAPKDWKFKDLEPPFRIEFTNVTLTAGTQSRFELKLDNKNQLRCFLKYKKPARGKRVLNREVIVTKATHYRDMPDDVKKVFDIRNPFHGATKMESNDKAIDEILCAKNELYEKLESIESVGLGDLEKVFAGKNNHSSARFFLGEHQVAMLQQMFEPSYYVHHQTDSDDFEVWDSMEDGY